VKTIHRVEVTIDAPEGVTVEKSGRHDTRYSPSAPGYGTVVFLPTFVISAEGEREPVVLLNALREMAHNILDQLEGEA
jgi:hypothetical protein